MRQIAKTITHYAPWLVLGLAAVLRLPLLSSSFWLDEAAQALESARPWWQQLDIIPDFQPPLLHIWLHLAMYLGHSEVWLRLVGAYIPGLITVWFTYQLGKKWGNHRVGLLAALGLALSSFHVFYSQELRPYAWPAAWMTLSWWLIATEFQSNQGSVKRWWRWGLVSLLGIYSSYLYPFGLVTQVVYLWWRYLALRQGLVLTCFSIGAGFLPWLPRFTQQLAAGGMVRQALPGWSAVVSIPQLKSLPLVVAKFGFGVLDVSLTPAFIVPTLAVGAWLTQIMLTTRFKWRQWLTSPQTAIWLWLCLPIMLAWLVSFWIPVLQPKRVLFCLPAWYLGLAWLIDTKWQSTGKYVAALLISIQLWSLSAYYLTPALQRENWREVHTWVTTRYSADNSLALFAFDEPFAPWRWYDDGTYPTLAIGQLSVNRVPNLSEQLKSVTDAQYVVTFDYLTDLSDPEHRVHQVLTNFGYQQIELKSWPNVGFVRVWSRSSGRLGQRLL